MGKKKKKRNIPYSFYFVVAILIVTGVVAYIISPPCDNTSQQIQAPQIEIERYDKADLDKLQASAANLRQTAAEKRRELQVLGKLGEADEELLSTCERFADALDMLVESSRPFQKEAE